MRRIVGTALGLAGALLVALTLVEALRSEVLWFLGLGLCLFALPFLVRDFMDPPGPVPRRPRRGERAWRVDVLIPMTTDEDSLDRLQAVLEEHELHDGLRFILEPMDREDEVLVSYLEIARTREEAEGLAEEGFARAGLIVDGTRARGIV